MAGPSCNKSSINISHQSLVLDLYNGSSACVASIIVEVRGSQVAAVSRPIHTTERSYLHGKGPVSEPANAGLLARWRLVIRVLVAAAGTISSNYNRLHPGKEDMLLFCTKARGTNLASYSY